VLRTSILACAVGTVVAFATGGYGSMSSTGAASSPIRVVVTRWCPKQIGVAKGVSNPHVGDELVPPNPIAGLICRYSPPSPFDQSGEVSGSLYAQVKLTGVQAVHLTGVIDSISTAVPPDGAHCPAESLSASIIAFAYANAPDVDLWFKDSGCQTLDNGTLEASQIANPIFDGPFEALISEWAPGRL
jgi:hypothetical protein